MKLSLAKIRLWVIIVALMLLSGGIGWRIGKNSLVRFPHDKTVRADLTLFWQVWDKLEENYLLKSKLQPQEMVWGAIKGMTQALDDPYTVFLPPADNQDSKDDLNGSFSGVGIELGYKEKTLAVIAPLSGTPAETAGIKAGDYILHIKDESKQVDQETTDLSLPQAVRLIRGPQGTTVELTILREGIKEPQVIKLTRETIVIKSVEVRWLDGNIALLKLSQFGGRTAGEWDEAVKEITARAAVKGIILDLRNNPGGYLEGAIKYASEFLPAGKLIVKQAGKDGKIQTYTASAGGRLTTQNLVVLINAGSASSSEILAGALRDNQRAKLVGQKSFGKGTIQEALDLSENAGLHITTASWLTPNGTWVNDTHGLPPDVEIADDKAVAKGVELLKI